MKNYIKILSYIGIMMLLFQITSCVPLDVTPYDRGTDADYWKKPDAAVNMVNKCYEGLTSAEEIMYADAMSDNAYTKVGIYTQSIANGSLSTADDYVALVWDSKYAGIRNCNLLLNNIHLVPGLTDELRTRYIGEATFIRAFHYFELYSKYGDIPYFTHVISIKESQEVKRTEKDVVIENILEELSTIIDNNYLPTSYTGADKGRVTRWAAMALKARILMFEGRYSEVKSITSKIITEGGFQLYPSYEELFTVAAENNSEVIFDIQYLLNSSREYNIQYHFIPPSIGGYAQLSPLQELVDDYITTDGYTIATAPSTSYNPSSPFNNRDPRLKATIGYTGNSYLLADGSEHTINCEKGAQPDGYGFSSDCSATGYYIKKYWDNTHRETFYSGLNIILIRYADVLLMHAEALAELNELNKTEWDITIRELRKRAGFTDANALDFKSGVDLKDIVRCERRCELALEGLRYKDIIRWQIAEDVLNGWCHGLYTGELVGTDNGFIRVEQRKFDKTKHYLWPIPQDERDLNKNLSQNDKW